MKTIETWFIWIAPPGHGDAVCAIRKRDGDWLGAVLEAFGGKRIEVSGHLIGITKSPGVKLYDTAVWCAEWLAEPATEEACRARKVAIQVGLMPKDAA